MRTKIDRIARSVAEHHGPSRWSAAAYCLTTLLAMSLSLPGVTGTADEERTLYTAPGNARELLALYGIDASQLERFQDGEPLGMGDEETLLRLLFHFPRFPLASLESWSLRDPVDWGKIVADPPAARAAVVRLSGAVKRVEKTPVLPEVARRGEIGHYYRVTLRLKGTPYEAVIATRVIPAQWPLDVELDESAGALAIFLKKGGDVAGQPQFVFAAPRIAWYPTVARSEYGITSDLVFLAQQGVDIGLLKDEENHNRKPLVGEDRESFYQLLSAMRRSSGQPLPHAGRQLSVGPLLQNPERHHGAVMLVEGQARQVNKVRVDEPDLQRRFGLDHYYQIDLFVPLKNQVVRLSKAKQGEAAPTFENSYPVTVCVPEVPPQLQDETGLPLQIRLPAAFFKLWAYRSEYVSSFNKNQLQLSPMLVGVTPEVVQVEAFSPQLGIGLAVVVVVALLGLWLGLLRFGRHSGSTARAVWQKHE